MKKNYLFILCMIIAVIGNYSLIAEAETNSYKYYYFGSYFQDVVRDKNLSEELWKQDFTDGVTTYNGVKYAKKYMNNNGHYFFQESPIKWRVLKEDDKSFWLMSEKIIEYKKLSDNTVEKWANATLRKWLNEDFVDIAFENEKSDLITTSISSKTVSWDDINLSGNANSEGVDITNDKVWLLDQEEILDSTYGFTDNYSRIAYSTDYVDLYNSSQRWHLRGNPYYFYGMLHMATMNQDGSLHQQGGVADTNNYATNQFGIRPIIRVKKDSIYLYEENPNVKGIEKAKKISFYGKKYEEKYAEKYKNGVPEGSIKIEIDENDFSKSSLKYNHNLAMYGISMSTMMYNSGKNGEKNIEDALNNLGYDKIYTKLNFGKDYAGDESPVVIASKEVNLDGEKTSLIGVYIRGTYEQEWINNFEIGKYSYGSDHQGFLGAAKKIEDELKKFISDNVSTGNRIKIFITGHSRGAAVANLLGSRLNDTLISSNDIFVYTYATPNTTSVRKSTREGYRYKNIFNIVNPEDFVTKVVPAKWGYGRYGKTYVLPSKTYESSSTYDRYKKYLSRLQEKYAESNPEEELTYQPYENGMSDVTDYVNSVTQEVGNLEEYYNKNIGSKDHNPVFGTLRHLYIGVLAYSCCKKYNSLGTKNAIIALNKNYWGRVGQKTVTFLLKNHFDIIKENDFLQPRFDWAHKSETYYGALMDNISEDYLTKDKNAIKGIVNCPVDVCILDGNGNVVGNIIDNKVVNQNESSVFMEVDGDSKIFYLPKDDSSFKIELKGNDNGTMDYSLAEIDLDTGEISRTVYKSVPIEKGATLQQSVDYENDAFLISELAKEDESVVEPYGEFDENSLGKLSVNVTVEGIGNAESLSCLSPGDYVCLEAVTDDNNEFLGWYNSEGKLLSKEAKYIFTIFENVEYTAKFTNNVVSVESIEFDSPIVHANVGDCIYNEYNIYPKNATNVSLEYTSSNDSVVTIDEFGTIEAKSEGIACITAKTYDGAVNASFNVAVGDIIEIGNQSSLTVTDNAYTNRKVAYGIFMPDKDVLYDFRIPDNTSISFYDIDSKNINERNLEKGKIYRVCIDLENDFNDETVNIFVQEKEIEYVGIDYEQSKVIFNNFEEVNNEDIAFYVYFSDETKKLITDFTIEKYSDEVSDHEKYGDMIIVLKTIIAEKEYSEKMHIIVIPEYDIDNSIIELSAIKSYYDNKEDEWYYFIRFVPDEDGYYQFLTSWNLNRTYSFKIVDEKNNYKNSYEKGVDWYTEKLCKGKEYYIKILDEDYVDNGSITINKLEYTDVEFESKKIYMKVGDTQKLSVIISPNDSLAKVMYYLSYDSDEKIIIIDDEGNVTAESIGTVNVCVKTSTGSRDECEIVVTSAARNDANNTSNIDNNNNSASENQQTTTEQTSETEPIAQNTIYKYVLNEDKSSITITKCTSSEQNIEIPSVIDGYTVVGIGDNAFENITAMRSVKIPETIKDIGKYAFSGCTALKAVTLPNSLKTLGTYAFNGCTALETAVVNQGRINIVEGMFQNCSSLTSVTIPASVNYIRENAFANCTSLTTLSFPKSLVKIEKNAFLNTKITTLNYAGNKKEWGKISIVDGGNAGLLNARVSNTDEVFSADKSTWISTEENNIVKKPTVSKVKSFKVKANKNEFKFSWKKLSGVAGYQIQVSTKKNFKDAKTKSVSKSKKTYTAKKLKANRKYYIRIRAFKKYKNAYGQVEKVYGNWVRISKKTK